MAVRMTTGQLAEIEALARAAVPEECCGILVGRREGDAMIVTAIAPSANVWESEDPAAPGPGRRTRFLLDPLTHLRVQREARVAGLDIVGSITRTAQPAGPVPVRPPDGLSWSRLPHPGNRQQPAHHPPFRALKTRPLPSRK